MLKGLMMAKLYFRYGPMNSGKTRLLLSTAYNYKEVGSRVLIIKPKIDTKAGEKLMSRAGERKSVDVLLEDFENVYNIIKNENNLNPLGCVLVDEAQFLSPEQVDELFNVVIFLNIPVIAYGLRSDFKREMFPGSKRLMELAHSLEELKTICWNNCGRKAIFNARMVDGVFVKDGGQVVIDGESNVEYHSLCGHCYEKLVN